MPLLPFARRNFRLVLGASVASSLGDNLHNLALPLLILSVTGSSSQAGLVLALGTIAHLFGGPVAGAVVDRLERRAVMIWCDIGRAILVASLPIALAIGEFHMLQAYIVTVLLGALTTLFQSASNALLPRIVDSVQLPGALSKLQASGSAVGILGTPLAGIVYGLGRSVPFVFNALSFIGSAAAVRSVRADTRPLDDGPRTSLRADVREGLQWLSHQPIARRLTLIQAADNLRYGAGYLLIILLARRAGAGPTEVGLVFSGAAAGAAIGAAVGGRLVGRFAPGRLVTRMLCVEAAAFPLYALVPTWPWLLLIAFAESVVLLIYVIALTSYRLSVTPDRLLGRMSGTVTTLTTGASSLGALLGGLLIPVTSLNAFTFGCAAWLAAIALVDAASRFRASRRGGRAGSVGHDQCRDEQACCHLL